MTSSPMCYQDGKCFAKNKGYCRVLMSTVFKGGKCPFQKDKVEVTDGKVFPYDPTYGNSKGVTFNANDAKTEDS